MRKFFRTIVSEMSKGNFLFLILVVGVVQIMIMVANLILLSSR